MKVIDELKKILLNSELLKEIATYLIQEIHQISMMCIIYLWYPLS